MESKKEVETGKSGYLVYSLFIGFVDVPQNLPNNRFSTVVIVENCFSNQESE